MTEKEAKKLIELVVINGTKRAMDEDTQTEETAIGHVQVHKALLEVLADQYDLDERVLAKHTEKVMLKLLLERMLSK